MLFQGFEMIASVTVRDIQDDW